MFSANCQKHSSFSGSLFTPVANRVYPAAIALQPFQALTGVYGPLLMAVQGLFLMSFFWTSVQSVSVPIVFHRNP